MNALSELLAWLATGGALTPTDEARYHDALALRLDADRHAVAELSLVLGDPGNTLTHMSRTRLETLLAALDGGVLT